MNNDELIAAGHELAKCLDSNTPLLDIAKLLSKMANQLDVTAAALRERAEPVVTPKPFLWYGQVFMNVYGCKDGDESRIPLYTAPSAQVVPDVERMKEIYSLFCTPTTGSDNAMVAIHKACRAAMLATPSGKKE